MRTRPEIHAEFVKRFHFGKRCKSVPAEKLDAIEAALKTHLPASYREFMQRHSVVYTPSILDEITAKKLHRSDLQEFFKPKDVIEYTQMSWSGGMPDDVIGFASDCMGSMFGFLRQALPSDDSPVVFFDHDYVTVEEIAPSFDEFLSWYLDHLQGPGPADG